MEKITVKDLKKMKLHETKIVDNWCSVMKVLNGWIYTFSSPPSEGTDFGIFVPRQGKS